MSAVRVVADERGETDERAWETWAEDFMVGVGNETEGTNVVWF